MCVVGVGMCVDIQFHKGPLGQVRNPFSSEKLYHRRGRETTEHRIFLKTIAVRSAFCYNTTKPCCAGWAGFNNPPSLSPFRLFSHTQDSQHSIFHRKEIY